MPTLGQGFLNSWLKVNNKHVVIPNKNDKEGKIEGSKLRKPSPETVMTERTVKSSIEEERTQIIRRFSNRKNKKRLNRTISASDLIRDQISGKGSKKNVKDGVVDNEYASKASAGSSSNSIFGSNRSQHQITGSIFGSNRSQHHAAGSIFGSNRSQHQASGASNSFFDSNDSLHQTTGTSSNSTFDSKSQHKTQQQQQQYQDEYSLSSSTKPIHQEHMPDTASQTNGSLRFVAGFFGADIDIGTLGSGNNDAQKHHHRLAKVSGPNGKRHSASGGSSVPGRIKPKAPGGGGGGMGLRFPPNIFALESSVHSEKKCQHCSELEDELALAREDVEYLRGISLRNEYSNYSPDQQQDDDNQGEAPNRYSSLEESESTQHIEIEEMKKEWATMQDEMQQEIRKYADLCVKLNEEAEFRSNEAMNLHVELNSVSRERDEMATEAETLRAKVAEYEKRETEHRKAETLLQQYEEHGLESANREIGVRDAMIEELSKRLEFALDTLSMEREKQNQRRQIIFPNKSNHNNSSATAMERELRSTKESLQRAEETIELLRRETNGGVKRG
ncbi:unnamed protein product [Cylindrotheca closterium]|uniref:Uncharacterized protein n=1 Tax=Cylindrotheca closterium TaxID=2856 RepID=A0AAD2JQ48_9STRA|nr:unnamed protein product [Cylindrotheca closterium]